MSGRGAKAMTTSRGLVVGVALSIALGACSGKVAPGPTDAGDASAADAPVDVVVVPDGDLVACPPGVGADHFVGPKSNVPSGACFPGQPECDVVSQDPCPGYGHGNDAFFAWKCTCPSGAWTCTVKRETVGGCRP